MSGLACKAIAIATGHGSLISFWSKQQDQGTRGSCSARGRAPGRRMSAAPAYGVRPLIRYLSKVKLYSVAHVTVAEPASIKTPLDAPAAGLAVYGF